IESSRVSRSGVREGAWESGAEAGVDRDGSIDDATDEDEEWIVEARFPIASLSLGHGAYRFAARLSRCDTPKAGGTRCGVWNNGSPPPELATMEVPTVR